MQERVKINTENREDIIRAYCHKLLDDMDFDTLYSFSYHMLVDNKSSMDDEALEEEIVGYYPDVLEK